ncbi:hypothetical protein Bca101_049389 [Brassica carinata]
MGYPSAPMRLHTGQAKRSTTNTISFNTAGHKRDNRQQANLDPTLHSAIRPTPTTSAHNNSIANQRLRSKDKGNRGTPSTASTHTKLDFSSTAEELLTMAREKHLSQHRQETDAGEAKLKEKKFVHG